MRLQVPATNSSGGSTIFDGRDKKGTAQQNAAGCCELVGGHVILQSLAFLLGLPVLSAGTLGHCIFTPFHWADRQNASNTIQK
jgi:hypothetical protein